MENWRQAALGANRRNKRIVLVSTYSKKAIECVLVHTCPWKPFDVKHRLLQRVAMQNKTNIISLFVVYSFIVIAVQLSLKIIYHSVQDSCCLHKCPLSRRKVVGRVFII